MRECEFCGYESMDHDYEHLARECYPAKMKAFRAELDTANEVIAELRRNCNRAWDKVTRLMDAAERNAVSVREIIGD